ncbi:hypothetical protein [Streptomyces sp. SID3343]|uniref:hypothetical protein n=1 Tax=Streptomyces sp. SID3343 TaxID=2690260 RepID=UPI00136ECBF4|nr:hypothetical protein [Streptomyces sp. SID3343]MYW05514.1 hypothetical protein [Streptomyces sp. SID3343]
MVGNRTGAAAVLIFAFLTFGTAACAGDSGAGDSGAGDSGAGDRDGRVGRVGAETIDRFLADIRDELAARSKSCPQSAADTLTFAGKWRNAAPVEGALFARAVDAHVSAYTTLCYDAYTRAKDPSIAPRKLESANAAYRDWLAAVAEYRRS